MEGILPYIIHIYIYININIYIYIYTYVYIYIYTPYFQWKDDLIFTTGVFTRNMRRCLATSSFSWMIFPFKGCLPIIPLGSLVFFRRSPEMKWPSFGRRTDSFGGARFVGFVSPDVTRFNWAQRTFPC